MNKQILEVYKEKIRIVEKRINTYFLDFDTLSVNEKCRYANAIMFDIHHLNTIVDSLQELKLITDEETFKMKEQIYFLSKEYACSVNDKVGRIVLDVEYEDFLMFETPKARELFLKEFNYNNKKPICNYGSNQIKLSNVEEYANRLKECRKARNMTQTELASELGLTKQSIINYEKGITFPTKEKLKKLNEIFGI